MVPRFHVDNYRDVISDDPGRDYSYSLQTGNTNLKAVILEH